MQAIAIPANVRPSMLVSTLCVAKRAILKFVRTPQLIVFGTLQGALFLMIFRYVFGGAIDSGGLDYVHFLVPGFITTTILFSGQGAAVGAAEDLQQGFVDRLRSLPVPRSSIVWGSALADSAVMVWNLVLICLIGFLVGFRIHGSVGDALMAFALVVIFGFAFEWVFLSLGLIAGNAQAAQGLAFLVFPLTFVSSAYVPVESMPTWMQGFAEYQPITLMVDAVRALTQGAVAESLLGHSAGFYVSRALVWSGAIIAIFAPLAALRYRRG
jgi:ABC-2 type transport system permease protein